MMLPEVQLCLISEAVKPDPLADVTIAYAHRYKADVGSSRTGRKRRGDDFASQADGDRAKSILPPIFTGDHQFRATA